MNVEILAAVNHQKICAARQTKSCAAFLRIRLILDSGYPLEFSFSVDKWFTVFSRLIATGVVWEGKVDRNMYLNHYEL